MRTLPCAMGAIALSLLAPCAVAALVTWTGAGDGTTWHQPTNWSSQPALPGADDDVVIPPGVGTVVIDTDPVAIASLNLGRELRVNARLGVTGGITLGADLTLAGTLAFDGGTQTLAGTASVRSVSNSSAFIDVANGCRLAIAPGVRVRAATGEHGASFLYVRFYAGAGAAQPGVTSAGAFEADRDCSLYLVNFTGGGAPDFASTGTITLDTQARLGVGRGVRFDNAGALTLGDRATLLMSGTLVNIGALTRGTGSTFSFSGPIAPGGTFTVSNATGPVLLRQGTYTNVTIDTRDDQTYSIFGGRYDGCTLAGNGTVTRDANISPASWLVVDHGITLTGSLTLGGRMLLDGGTQSIAGTGTITVLPGGSIDALSGCQLTIEPSMTLRTPEKPTPNSTQYVAMLLTPSDSHPPVQASITNRGTIQIGKRGFFSISCAGTPAFINLGTLELAKNTGLSLAQGLRVVQAGTMHMRPGATLSSYADELIQTPAGELVMDIDGPADDYTHFPRIGLVGNPLTPSTLKLGGTLRVRFTDDFRPGSCQRAYPLIDGQYTVTSVNGTFDGVMLPAPTSPSHRSDLDFALGSLWFLYTSKADLTGREGLGWPDGLVTPSDLIWFMNRLIGSPAPWTAALHLSGDVTDVSGSAGPDGRLTAADAVAFFGAYFAGCP